MKKNGFTLAEVLITLAIIGVVATLTLPALLTNTGEQQAKTALKKGLNILTEAAQMNQAVDGFDFASIANVETKEGEQSLYGLLDARTNVDYEKSGFATETNKEAKKVEPNNATNYVVFFRDGSAISFDPSMTKKDADNKKEPYKGKVGNKHADGLPNGFAVVFDTNGAKGPNLLSNCQGAGDRTTKDEDPATGACNKKDRVIQDQFSIRLRGGYAVPNGAAAKWAFEN